MWSSNVKNIRQESIFSIFWAHKKLNHYWPALFNLVTFSSYKIQSIFWLRKSWNSIRMTLHKFMHLNHNFWHLPPKTFTQNISAFSLKKYIYLNFNFCFERWPFIMPNNWKKILFFWFSAKLYDTLVCLKRYVVFFEMKLHCI